MSNVIARSAQRDEAISVARTAQVAGWLRGACHRAGQRPDPLARNDGRGAVATIHRTPTGSQQAYDFVLDVFSAMCFTHPVPPTEGVLMRRMRTGRMRRLRVRPRQPSLRGPRETLPGPTTWVRPATGWWGRMNAGETPRNQGRTAWAPLSVSRRRSRDLRKTPQWSAARRAGPRYGPAIPFRRRDWSRRKADQRPRRSAAANFGAPLPSVWGAKGTKPTLGTEAGRDAPRGSTPARLNK